MPEWKEWRLRIWWQSRGHALSVEKIGQSGWVGHYPVRSFIIIFAAPLFRTFLGLVSQIMFFRSNK